MSDPYRIEAPEPELRQPVLIIALSGWIDASGAAASAMETLADQFGVRTLVRFDDDLFIDYRARRPIMELRDGVSERLVWNVPELSVGSDRHGHDVLLLAGPEPDMAWRSFARCVGELAERFGVRQMIGLGAYPFATPHTRATRVSCTTPSASVLEKVPYLRSSLDVPAGAEAVLEHELHSRGVEALGIWAQVPHYAAAMACPAATAALLDAAAEFTGLTIDSAAVHREALIQRQRLDSLVASNDEHAQMLRQLEAAYDEAADELDPRSLPSGEELAQEVEQFLREQGDER